MDSPDHSPQVGDNSSQSLPDTTSPQVSSTCMVTGTSLLSGTLHSSTDLAGEKEDNSDRTKNDRHETGLVENQFSSQSQSSNPTSQQADIRTSVSLPLVGIQTSESEKVCSPPVLTETTSKGEHSLNKDTGKDEKIPAQQFSGMPDAVASHDRIVSDSPETGRGQVFRKASTDVEADNKDHNSDDQSDYEIISLSEEETPTQFVITNVCTISEEDARFDNKTDDKHSENARQPDSTLHTSPDKERCTSDHSHPKNPGDADGSFPEAAALSAQTSSAAAECSNVVMSTSAARETSGDTAIPTSVTNFVPAPKDATVTGFSKVKDSSAVCVSKHQPQHIMASTAEDAVSGTMSVSTATSAVSSSFNVATAFLRDVVKRVQTETESSSKTSNPHSAPQQGENEGEPAEYFTVKFEPEDAGYETGPGAARNSSSASVSGGHHSAIGQALGSSGTCSGSDVAALSSVSADDSEMQGTERQVSEKEESSDQIKTMLMMKACSKGLSLTTQVQLKQRLGAAQATTRGSPSCGSDVHPADSDEQDLAAQAEGEKLHSMLIKPLLVPASLVSKQPSSQSQSLTIPTKSVCINLPATLSRCDSSVSPDSVAACLPAVGVHAEKVALKNPVTSTGNVITTSHPTVAVPSQQVTMATNSQRVTIAATTQQASTAVGSQQVSTATSSQQLNQQLVSHLRYVQDKPGSYQMLTIPMPDGSSHNVKVIFAPTIQQVGATSSVSQSLIKTPQASTTHITPLSLTSADRTTTSTHPPSITSVASTSVSAVQLASQSSTASVTTSAIPQTLSPFLSSTSTREAPPMVLVNSRNQQFFTLVTSVNRLSNVQTSVTSTSSQVLGIGSQNTSASALAASKVTTANSTTAHVSTNLTPSGVKAVSQTAVSCVGSTSTCSSTVCDVVSQGTKRDLRVDQVSADSKLSASDMAALIQGKNLLPSLEPTRRPGKGACNKVYRCVECGVMCCTLVGYTVHVKRMSMVIRYACMTCKAALVFFNKCTFLAHLRRHSATDTASGHVVNLKSYTMSVSSLPNELLPPIELQHMDPLVINRNQSITCRECLLSLPDTSQLAAHFGSNATRCYFKHPCSHCHMELPSPCAHRAHLRLHDEESHSFCARPNFVCPECGLVFANQVSLYQHLFATCLHFSRCVSLRCSVCSQFYPTLAVLREHLIAAHPNSRRYQCYLCKRCYHSLQSFRHHFTQLHRHLQHSQFEKDKLYQMTSTCHMCDTQLEGAAHAHKHLQQEKERAMFGFACLFCQDTTIFGQRSELVIHLALKHNAYRFCCSICEQGFVTVTLLRIHVLCEHGSLRSRHQGAVLCGQCSAGKLSHESVLPHVMWHVMKKLTDPSNTTGTPSKLLTEITVPKVHALSSDRQKQMLMCRICGHISLTRYSMQRHMSQAQHLFCRKYSVCPFCQRYDFVDSVHFEAHTKRCLTDSGVHSTILIPEDDEEETPGDRSSQNGSTLGANATSQNCATSDSSIGFVVASQSPPRGRVSSSALQPQPKPSVKKKSQARKRPAEGSRKEQTDTVMVRLTVGARGLQQQTGGTRREFPVTKVSVPEDPTEEIDEMPPALHACHLCGLIYPTAQLLSQHVTKNHGGEKNVVRCQLCFKKGKEVMMTRASLRKHLTRRHHVAASTADAIITETGDTMGDRAQDQSEVSKQLTDSDNSASPTSASPAKRLKIAGGNGQDYVCVSCGFASPTIGVFREHITTHWQEGWLQCPECGLCVRTMSSLCKHLSLVHKVSQPDQYLKQNSIRVDQLPQHILSRMDSLTPLVLSQESRVYHEALHSDSLPADLVSDGKRGESEAGVLECTVCYKEFTTTTELQSHMRTHGMAFIRSRRLHARQKATSTTSATEQPAATSPVDTTQGAP